MRSRSRGVVAPPVGFAGLLKMSIRVRGVTRRSAASTSNEKPLSSRTGTGTTRAPAKRTTDS